MLCFAVELIYIGISLANDGKLEKVKINIGEITNNRTYM